MNLGRRFPLLRWFLTRSIIYYVFTGLIFAGCVEFYIWHFLYLQQVRQLYYTNEKKNPYSAIRYFEYLIETGLANDGDCVELARNYLLIGDRKSAERAYHQAFRRVSPNSQGFHRIMESYQKDFPGGNK